LDRHQQNDEIAAIQKKPEDADGEQNATQYQIVSQRDCHFLSLPFDSVCEGMLTSRRRSLARTRTCFEGSVRLTSLRLRSVSAMAATMPTSRMTAPTCTANTYWEYIRLPRAR